MWCRRTGLYIILFEIFGIASFVILMLLPSIFGGLDQYQFGITGLWNPNKSLIVLWLNLDAYLSIALMFYPCFWISSEYAMEKRRIKEVSDGTESNA